MVKFSISNTIELNGLDGKQVTLIVIVILVTVLIVKGFDPSPLIWLIR